MTQLDIFLEDGRYVDHKGKQVSIPKTEDGTNMIGFRKVIGDDGAKRFQPYIDTEADADYEHVAD